MQGTMVRRGKGFEGNQTREGKTTQSKKEEE
jgi:hypothetical protein